MDNHESLRTADPNSTKPLQRGPVWLNIATTGVNRMKLKGALENVSGCLEVLRAFLLSTTLGKGQHWDADMVEWARGILAEAG